MGPDDDAGSRSLPVAWDEARELLALVLLVAASMIVVAPSIRYLGAGRGFGFRDDLSTYLGNIGPTVGILLLASAVLVATTPAADLVPALRTAVLVVAATVTVLGVAAILLEITESLPADSARIHIASIFTFRGPGTILSGTAAWMALRVRPFPT